MTQGVVDLERRGPVAILTLSRPQKRNAISQEMGLELARLCREISADESVGAVVLTGAAGTFSAGLDLDDLRAGRFHVEGGLMQAVRDIAPPTVAAISGACVTGALEMVLSCDLRLCDPSAYFADTHAHVGVLPAGGMTVLLPRVVGQPRALEMSLTGRRVEAAQAEQWGLVNRIVDTDVLDEAVSVAERIAEAGPVGRRVAALVAQGLDLPLADALACERASGLTSMAEFSAAQPSDR